jgi:iron complex transport system substrate-binding protein
VRIASLQPTATEILYAIGQGRNIVARSHECTYPPAALSKPVVVTPLIDPEKMTQAQIDDAVRRAGREGTSLYRVDAARLNALSPDIVFTQTLCDV